MEKQGEVPDTQAGTPTLHSSAPRPNLFTWPGNADLTHIGDGDSKGNFISSVRHPTRKEGVRNQAAASSSASRHFLGNDGTTEDPVLTSALGADPAGVRACTALLWPGSNVPTVHSTACGPSGDRWQ